MDFGEFMQAALKAAGLSINAFADTLGKSSGNLTNIINGSVVNKLGTIAKPPLAEMDTWAKVLQLNEAQRLELIELAELAHTPPGIRAKYLALKGAQPVAGSAPAKATTPSRGSSFIAREARRQRAEDAARLAAGLPLDADPEPPACGPDERDRAAQVRGKPLPHA